VETLRPLTITGELQYLNKLKQINPDAFYYWYQASLLSKEI